jgi:riboflavin biosynthesis pyrimidine reductase
MTSRIGERDEFAHRRVSGRAGDLPAQHRDRLARRLGHPDPGPGGHRPTSRIVRRADADDEIRALKGSPGRDILMFGSHVLWNDLLDHDLVDQVHLMIGAGVLGEGTPAFERRPPGTLRLLGTRTWDDSGLVLARYAVEPPAES